MTPLSEWRRKGKHTRQLSTNVRQRHRSHARVTKDRPKSGTLIVKVLLEVISSQVVTNTQRWILNVVDDEQVVTRFSPRRNHVEQVGDHIGLAHAVRSINKIATAQVRIDIASLIGVKGLDHQEEFIGK